MNKYEIELRTAKNGNKLVYPALTELVERATPKKVIVINFIQGIYHECPICHNQVIRNHCCDNNECRQALDWSE